MNLNWKKIAEGVLLSFIPLFTFVFFVYGSQAYLLSDNANPEEVFLGSVSNAQLNESDELNTEPAEINLEENEANTINTDINAKTALSIKKDSQGNKIIIFAKNEDLKLPIASLTKLMTAVICFENYDLAENIIVSEKADSQLPMQTDLKLGDTFSIDNFLHVMLVESSNKAAYALAEKVGEEYFVSLMNQKATEIGLRNTYFADPTGLSSENVSTANDLVLLAEYILDNHPEISQITTTKNYKLENLGEIKNTNQLLTQVPGIILGKTGFTNFANGCLLIVSKNLNGDGYLINIVLGADDRFTEMKKLISWQNNLKR